MSDYINDNNQEQDNGVEIMGNKRSVTYKGSMTVNGTGELKIPCRGRPYEVSVRFVDPALPVPCAPTTEDTIEIEIDYLRRPFPLWAIKISWDIASGNIREVMWDAITIVK